LVYTPEEYDEQLEKNVFFREEIGTKGKVVYAK
jgi:hypothetical protein